MKKITEDAETYEFMWRRERDARMTLEMKVEKLEADLVIGIRQRQNKAEDFLMREGYRACDMPACNCGSWHKGKAND